MERRKAMDLCQLEEIDSEVCPVSPDGKHKRMVKSFPPKPKRGEKWQHYEFYCLHCGKEFNVPYNEVNKP